jgi:ribose transport system permease protein
MSLARHLVSRPWLWSFIAAFAAWLSTILFTGGQGGGGLITAALTFATFFVIVGIGQMRHETFHAELAPQGRRV